jgi:hypothetical protein
MKMNEPRQNECHLAKDAESREGAEQKQKCDPINTGLLQDHVQLADLAIEVTRSEPVLESVRDAGTKQGLIQQVEDPNAAG